ncbi:hypothetical protein IFM89_005611 [Coptis chinensis]|uniref:Uncharacterized protein n=1 Tax=Coptis chinensis TaxID=261450 RepID=A0A835LR08_9MAGN|nr:hypothetical protein IFM89_005611 [Coptis chinensis]
MSNSGDVSIAPSYGESRLYYSYEKRQQQHHHHHQQQQQQLLFLQQKQKQQEKLEKEMNLKGMVAIAASTTKVENQPSSNDSTIVRPGFFSNLDSFLQSTTPYVPAQLIPKTMVRGRRNGEVGYDSYFILDDLWKSYEEWSAYGVGVPLLLNGSESVTQYYVPYLSAIQLYVKPTMPSYTLQRQPGVSDVDYSNSEDIKSDSNSSLKFQYFEMASPYTREPLANKISNLSLRFPALETYKSCDLLPKSWISVAWYPIYRIPVGPILRDLDDCFLTFQSLSTPLSSTGNGQLEVCSPIFWEANGATGAPAKISLPIFGLASHKFTASVWDTNGHYERQRTNSLLFAADNWIRRSQVDHPDYRFFVSHNIFNG